MESKTSQVDQVAKKKSVKDSEKGRLQLRVDTELLERLTLIAEEASISVNQLVTGLLEWGTTNANAGEAYIDEAGHVRTRPEPGCIWFGQVTYDFETGAPGETDPWPGKLVFQLDYTARRTITTEPEVNETIPPLDSLHIPLKVGATYRIGSSKEAVFVSLISFDLNDLTTVKVRFANTREIKEVPTTDLYPVYRDLWHKASYMVDRETVKNSKKEINEKS